MALVNVHVVDASFEPLGSASIQAKGAAGQGLQALLNEGRWQIRSEIGTSLTIEVTAQGFEPLRHELRVHGEVNAVGLGKV